MGVLLIRETGRRPDLWGIPRHYLTLLKIGTLFAARSLRWMWTLLESQTEVLSQSDGIDDGGRNSGSLVSVAR